MSSLGLSTLLVTSKTRENAGSRSDERFNYQKDLSLYLMIDYYKKVDDFVFLFDFHDDLAIIDSEATPETIEFYQIKTKSKGNWTLGNLLKTEKDKNSYLGKLYFNKIVFGQFVKSLSFISNAKYNITLKDETFKSDSKYEIPGRELCDTAIDEINSKILTELKLTGAPEFDKLLTFRVSNLSLTDSKTHCKGALSEMIEIINPGKPQNVNLTYNKIFNEIRIKTDCVASEFNIENLSIIIEKKGITRKQFVAQLIEACNYKSIEQQWSEIEQKLNVCGLGYFQVKNFKAKFRELSLNELHSPNDTPLLKTIEYLLSMTNYCFNDPDVDIVHFNYFQLMELIFDTSKSSIPFKHYDDMTLKTIILKILNND
ncbi:DUF4297 domain-containing protein [Spirosoma sp. HMF3257]|uniref:CD-NTase associated protein 4-like DNA endonuclease domain-containing protein n=1 Tax=Spirosoma telluris TaxID=2183553 RepID=A0A327NHA4_9BACT|nr:DUF4297 domain-containing protein [Spirosoma telluris]RAI73314.1 hypothetical protein HMF3257_00660 [Spirosoma telluris]